MTRPTTRPTRRTTQSYSFRLGCALSYPRYYQRSGLPRRLCRYSRHLVQRSDQGVGLHQSLPPLRSVPDSARLTELAFDKRPEQRDQSDDRVDSLGCQIHREGQRDTKGQRDLCDRCDDQCNETPVHECVGPVAIWPSQRVRLIDQRVEIAEGFEEQQRINWKSPKSGRGTVWPAS